MSFSFIFYRIIFLFLILSLLVYCKDNSKSISNFYSTHFSEININGKTIYIFNLDKCSICYNPLFLEIKSQQKCSNYEYFVHSKDRNKLNIFASNFNSEGKFNLIQFDPPVLQNDKSEKLTILKIDKNGNEKKINIESNIRSFKKCE